MVTSPPLHRIRRRHQHRRVRAVEVAEAVVEVAAVRDREAVRVELPYKPH